MWHNLNVMQIEKNVFDDIINVIMNVKRKSKDNINTQKVVGVIVTLLRLLCHRIVMALSWKPAHSYLRTKKEAIWMA